MSVIDLIIVSVCIAADVVSGLLAAWMTKSFRSDKMREGAGHKLGELIAMGCVYGVQYGLPFIGVQTSINFVRAFAIYIIIMEVSSVFENIIKLDPELSGPLGTLLNSLKGVLNRDE